MKAKLQASWRATQAVCRAVKAGKLANLGTTPIKCVDCGKTATVYDHRDYDKPLDVSPVCASCNMRRGPAAYPANYFIRDPKIVLDNLQD